MTFGSLLIANQNPVGYDPKQVIPEGADAPEITGHHGRPLADFLNPDGTLALPPEGIQGSIDPAGFQMTSAPGEMPRFEPAGHTGLAMQDYLSVCNSRFLGQMEV